MVSLQSFAGRLGERGQEKWSNFAIVLISDDLQFAIVLISDNKLLIKDIAVADEMTD